MELDILQQILSKVTSIESDVKDLKQGLTRLEQRQDKLEQRQADLEHGQAGLASLLHGVIQHQNEDFALLQSLDQKVTDLIKAQTTYK